MDGWAPQRFLLDQLLFLVPASHHNPQGANLEKILWRAMLDSDFNSLYWRAITQKYSSYDNWLKIYLALSASGTVAGWTIWANWPIFWKILSASAAIASIASPILSFSKKAEVAAGHAGLWSDLRVRYSDLWDKFKSTGESPSITKENDQLKKIFRDLESKEPKLKIPENKKLAQRCQSEVLKSKHLI